MKILIPVDGSEASLCAVRHALRLQAEGLQAEFVLANVQEPATVYEMLVVHDAARIEQVSESAGAHLLQRAEALLRSQGVTFEREQASGDPGPMLIEIAERHRCEAIIMGARGHGALRGALMGSVSQQVLERSAVPVTIVQVPLPER